MLIMKIVTYSFETRFGDGSVITGVTGSGVRAGASGSKTPEFHPHDLLPLMAIISYALVKGISQHLQRKTTASVGPHM